MGRARTVPLLCGLAALVTLAGRAAAEEPARKPADDLRKQVLALNQVTGDDAMVGRLRQLLADKAQAKKLVEAAVGIAKEKNSPLEYNGAVILAKAAYYLRDYPAGEALYRLATRQAAKLQSTSKLFSSYEGLLTLLLAAKRYDDAVTTSKEFLELEGDKELENLKPFIMEYMVKAMALGGKTDEALKLADKLSETGWYFLRLKGFVLREAGKYKEAIEVYQEVLDKLGQQEKMKPELRDDFTLETRYVLSNLYMETGETDKAIKELRQLVKAKPENATFLNDLGYIMADNNQDLDEAEKMIRKALDLDRAARKKSGVLSKDDDKDVAAYVDSLGWVLFKKKKYPEAKKYLLAATQDEDGKHIEIFDHLAQVYLALGDKAEAVKTWKEALKLPDVSPRDKKRREEIKKKIKDTE